MKDLSSKSSTSCSSENGSDTSPHLGLSEGDVEVEMTTKSGESGSPGDTSTTKDEDDDDEATGNGLQAGENTKPERKSTLCAKKNLKRKHYRLKR